jgi:hypothetical protein
LEFSLIDYNYTKKNSHSSSKEEIGKGVKRGATPEFVNMSKEILHPQIQGVTSGSCKASSTLKGSIEETNK